MRPPAQLLSLTLTLVVLASCSSHSPSPDAAGTAPSASTPASESPVSPTVPATPPKGVRVTDLGTRPVGLAAVGRGVWTALPDVGEVRTEDGRRIAVGQLPLRLVSTPAGVWVSLIDEGAVVRIDRASGAVDLRVKVGQRDSQPEGLAFDGTTVWVVDQAGDRVFPLDPATGVLGKPIPVGVGPRLVTTTETSVYVTSYTEGSVTRYNGEYPDTENAGSCLTPQGVAVVAGLLWVACTVDDQLIALDLDTLKPAARVPGLASADAVVGADDVVYVVGQRGPTVWTVDVRTREVLHELVLDDAGMTRENVDAVLLGDRLVVSHPEAKRLYDVPLRLLRP